LNQTHLAAAALIAVGSTPLAPFPPEPIRYGPSASRYLIHRHLRVQQTYQGVPQTEDLGARLYVSAAIAGPRDSAGYPTTFTIDSIVPDSGMPAPIAESVSKVRMAVFAGRLAPGGEFRSAGSPESALDRTVLQLVGGFRDFLPRIPATGAAPGASWTDTVSFTQHEGGTEITRHSVLHSLAPAWELRAGVRSLRIEASTTYRVTGSGVNGGQPFQISGAGTVQAHDFLAEDGRFVGGESQDSAALVVALPEQGLSIPVTQVLQSSVVTLP